jgi:hypothetical protein
MVLRRPSGAACKCDAPGPHHFDDAEGPKHLQQSVDLVLGAGDLDHQRIRRDVDDPAAEQLRELHDGRSRLVRGRDLDHRQVARDGAVP